MASSAKERIADSRMTEAASRSNYRTAIIAFTWGLAEALVFFVVPDVFLTRLALFDLGTALRACVWAIFGALLGGAALWFAAKQGYAPILLHTFRWVPCVTNDSIAAAGQAMQSDGALAMIKGGFMGRPYKLFAVHAGAQGIGLLTFLALSLVARAARFIVSTVAAWLIGRMLIEKTPTFRRRTHLVFWLVFYAAFLALMV
jgi:membrane protein YqaA with SNARE-associated domain